MSALIGRLGDIPHLRETVLGTVIPHNAEREGIHHRIECVATEPTCQILRGVDPWTADATSAAVKAWAQGAGVKPGILLPLYRIALTGGMSGPDVFALSELLGRDDTVNRWTSALRYFRTLSDPPYA